MPDPGEPEQSAESGADASATADAAGFMASRRAASIAALESAPRMPLPGPGQADSAAAKTAADPAGAPAESAEPQPTPTKDDPGLTALRKQEIHLKQQIAKERDAAKAEAEAERQRLLGEFDGLRTVKSTIENAKKDRMAAIRALGFSDADLAALATEIYAHSPEGQKDPRYKAQAEAKRAETEALSRYEQELAKRDEKLAKLEAWQAAQEEARQAADGQRRLDDYLDRVAGAATDATPLAKTALAKNPAATRNMLAQIADRLYMASGPSDDLRDVPNDADVLKEYDRLRAEELSMFGVDLETLGKTALKPTPPRPAATLAPAGGSPTPVRPTGRLSREDLIADIERMSQQRGR